MDTSTSLETPMVHHDFHWAKYVMAALLVLFASAIGFLYLVNRQNVGPLGQTDEDNTAVVMPKPVRAGTLKIVSESSNLHSLGEPVSVVVLGDSNGKDIVGYDILVTYDSNLLSNPKIINRNTSFEVTSYTRKKGYISITGTKSATNGGTNVFKNTALVKITFDSVQKGKSNVSIKQQVNNEKTKFVDVTFQHLYPQASFVSLEIL